MKSPYYSARSFILSLAIGLAASASIGAAEWAKPLAQDYVPIFHNEDRKLYVEGCGLSRLNDGSLLAIVPIVPRFEYSQQMRMEHSHIHVMQSADHGKSWQQISELPYYSAKAFEYGDALYLFAFTPGTEYRNDDLLLLKSGDHGRTWSAPVTLFKGHFWNCDTGMVMSKNRLYWSIDDLGLGGRRGPAVICGRLGGDLMNPDSWRISNSVAFPGVPKEILSPDFSNLSSQYLEPNVIEVNGRIRVLATVKPNRQSTANVCGLLDLIDDGNKLDLRFTQFSSMPGGQLKFCVIRDDVSKLFWSTANLVVDSHAEFPWWKEGGKDGNFAFGDGGGGNDRRFLFLQYSIDGINWLPAGCVARAGKISQSFMYARPVVDGDDLAIIARSSVNAPNQHDADYATFHRVKDFRRLAINPFPDSP